jgi:hypothetical protein
MKPLKNGFAAAQKSFPLRKQPAAIMIYDKTANVLPGEAENI